MVTNLLPLPAFFPASTGRARPRFPLWVVLAFLVAGGLGLPAAHAQLSLTASASLTTGPGASTLPETAPATTVASVGRAAGIFQVAPTKVYVKANIASTAAFGTDFTCPALVATGIAGIYAVNFSGSATSVPLILTPTADWVPDGDETFGFRLLNSSDSEWTQINPAPLYASPATGSPYYTITIQDVNMTESVALANGNTTEGVTNPLPTLTFTQDRNDVDTTVYFELTTASGNNLATKVTVQNNATKLSGQIYSVKVPKSSQSVTVTLTPLNDNLPNPSTDVTVTILPISDSRVASLVKYVPGTANAVTANILDTYPNVSVQTLISSILENDTQYSVIAVNRDKTVGALTVNLTQTAAQAQVVYDYYLVDSNGNNIAAPAAFSVTFPAGVAQVLLKMTAVRDGVVEGNERVAWKVATSLSYYSAAVEASVTIIDTSAALLNPTLNAIFTLDFENGMKGATSQYFVAPITNPTYYTLYPEADYLVGNDPFTYHNLFYNMYDHTKGNASGHMMIVNGSPTPGTVVLQFSVSALAPNQSFLLNYYGTSVNPQSPALMQMVVNGVSIGQVHFQSAQGWNQYTYGFTADANGQAVVQLINLNLDTSGNDFALDDFTVNVDPNALGTAHFAATAAPAGVKETDTTLTTIFNISRDADSTSALPQRFYFYPTVAQATFGVDYTSSQLKYDSVNNVYYADLAANQLSLAIQIQPVADWVPEPDEAFGFRLLGYNDAAWNTLQPHYVPGDANNRVVTIQDVSINASVVTLSANLWENQTTPTNSFAIVRDQAPIAGRVYFEINPSSTATFGVDYTGSGASLDPATGLFYVDFAVGETQKLISIQPLTDNVIEPTETIVLDVVDKTDTRLATATDVLYRKSGSPATAYLYDTSAVVNIAGTTTLLEGQASTVAFTITGQPGPTATRVYLELDPAATTASYPADFTTTDLTYDAVSGFFYADINFTNTPTKTISLTAVDDWVAEPTETIVWKLATPAEVQAKGLQANYFPGPSITATTTITDNSPKVDMTETKATWNEQDAASEVFRFHRSRTTQATRTYFKQSGGTAVIPDDFSLSGATYDTVSGLWYVDFPAGSAADVSVLLTPVRNFAVNGTRTTNFLLATPADLVAAGKVQGYALGTSGPFPVTILDSPTDISVAQLTNSLGEDAPSTSVLRFSRNTIDKSGWGTALRVYFTADGTAVAPNLAVPDYAFTGAAYDATLGKYYVDLAANVASVDIAVAPVDDWITEPDEVIGIHLASAASVGPGHGNVPTFPASSTNYSVALLDRTPTVAVTAATVTPIPENVGSSPAFTLTRSRSTKAQTVYLTPSGTATMGTDPTASGVDYVASSSATLASGLVAVNFAVGETTKTLSITPVDDWLPEPDEVAQWTLTPQGGSATSPGYTLGSPSTASVTLKDMTPVVTLSQLGTGSLREDATSTPVLNVTRTRSGRAQTIYLQAGGTATPGLNQTDPGADYTVDNNAGGTAGLIPVTFQAGATTATVSITPINDDIVESNESIVWTLQPSAGTPGFIPGAVTSLTTTLIDCTPTITIAAVPTATVLESAGHTSAFTITRDRSDKAQTVYLNSVGTAVLGIDPNVPGVDYTVDGPATVSNGVIAVVFAVGDTTKTISILPVDDLVTEAPETVKWQVYTPSNASGYAIGNPSSASFTMQSDPPRLTVKMTKATGEGQAAGTFTVQLDRSRTVPSYAQITLPFTLALSGPNAANRWQSSVSSPIVLSAADILAGSKQIVITPRQDLVYEGPQVLTLTASAGASVNFSLTDDLTKAEGLSTLVASMPFGDDEPVPVGRTLAAVIVSGAVTDPWLMVQNDDPTKLTTVTVKGGLIALAQVGVPYTAETLSSQPNLKIQSDPNLLRGTAIPPVMPVVIDARINKIMSSTVNTAGSP